MVGISSVLSLMPESIFQLQLEQFYQASIVELNIDKIFIAGRRFF